MDLIFLDKELTLWLNSFHNSFFDIFFYLFTDRFIWLPLYLIIALFIVSRQGTRGIMTILFIVILIGCTDFISAGIIKPLFERLRPSHDGVLQYMIHVVNCRRGGMYGFCSSHACNTFALATFFALMVRSKALSWTLFIWAIVNCYSRIYCGVHFVGDIVCGAILGAIIAGIAYQIYLRFSLHLFVISHHNKRTYKSGLAHMFGDAEPILTASTFWLVFIVLLLVANLMRHYGTLIGY